MTAVATPDAARLVFAAVAGLILLLILIIKFKVHAMISILIGAVGIGLMAGMPLADIIGSVNDGIGNTLKGIALLVGLGSMFGAILEESGGAQTLAVTMVRKFGDEKAAWALGITGLVIAMPVFFDAGLIILIPLAFSLAKRTKRSVLYYVIPLLAGLAVGHAFIPPTPGPVLVASMLGVDLGWVILIGINIVLLILGCVLETVSIILITLPMLYPIIKALGFDPIWFNVVLLINMELALITPPVGMNLFVIKGISEDSSIQDIIAGSAPFAFIMVLEIALLCFFPGIATWLPSVLK